ncbi:TonB-dependent receptor [Sphingomonas sinipercae]|uniref:TonB-dependent receptor n=1 Tax=Sphingomonas sinipercae TaxID=2714944 RepID=A0A6G7ZLE6_9SPHN|nr:TonB-dependent receptor [Sphingomonas sinipercae]QIL01740.1 TonB-dependent receptor [Sphingomonas sinipercae]
MNTRFRTALLSSTLIASAALVATPAFAQATMTPPAGEPDTTVSQPAESTDTTPVSQAPTDAQGEIIVTGSRIARPDLEASSPVAVISGESLRETNNVTVEQILAVNPQFASGFGQSSNNPGDGSATANLRGLEEERTLVLIDGKRAPAFDTNGRVDLNSIPTGLIKRIDILTGGASSVYGSDAIAGVVNFILDDRFKGIRLDGSAQTYGEGDGEIYNATLTAGMPIGDRGNIIGSIGWTKRNGVFFGDRSCCSVAVDSYDFTASGGSSNTVPTAFDIPGADRIQIQPDGSVTTDVALYNFNPVNYVQSPFRRINAMLIGRYELTDNIEAYARAMYADNKVQLQLAPTATAGFGFNIDPSNPFLSPDLYDAFFNTTANPDLIINDGTDVANDPTARAGTSNVGIRRRIIETGGRTEDFRTKSQQYVGGLRGDLGSFNWDVFAQWGQSKKHTVFRNDLSYTALQQALDVVDDGNGNAVCFNPANGCVPLNLFTTEPLSADSIAFVLRDAIEDSKTSQFIAGGNLGGDLTLLHSPLAAHPAAIALGVEYRKEKGSTAVDPLYASGDLIYYGQGQNISGSYDVREVYGEMKLPLIEDRPYISSLGLELGVRYSDYSNVGGVWSYKYGGDYAPVRGFRFRTIYQRAVRAPNIYELYSPVVAGTGGLSFDPCTGTVTAAVQAACIAQGAPASRFNNGVSSIPDPISGQINIFTGGNQNLEEEVSDTFTLGAVLSPTLIRGFSASVDYYKIKIKNAISDTSPSLTLDACFSNPSPNNPACTSIVRNPIDGSLSGDTTIGVPSQLGNVASIATKGFDFTAGYRGGVSSGVHYALNLAATWTRSYKFNDTECAGFFGPVCDYEPMPTWKHVAEATVGSGPWSSNTRWRYLSSVDADSDISGPDGILVQQIPSYSYFDQTFSYNLADRYQFRFGVLNVFNKKPPFVGDTTGATAGGGGTFPNTYDVLGRAFFVGATARF